MNNTLVETSSYAHSHILYTYADYWTTWRGYYLSVFGSNSLRLSCISGGAVEVVTPISMGEWHEIGWSVNGTAGQKIKLFLDKVKVGEYTLTANMPLSPLYDGIGGFPCNGGTTVGNFAFCDFYIYDGERPESFLLRNGCK